MTRRQLFVLIATILGSSVILLDGTIVNVALPKIGESLGIGLSGFQWIVDGYLLSLSALILLGGSIGDVIGLRKLYITGLIGFGIASLFCALAPNETVLVAIRVVQGVFGAMIVPGSLAIINTNFPKEKRGQAIGRWTAFISLATLLGPMLGGFILDIASWRWIFFINVPVVIICLGFAYNSIEEKTKQVKRHIDYAGAILAALSLSGITYGLIQGPTNHWSAASWLPLVAGVIFAIAFLVVESKSKDPMVHLYLFKNRNFSGANIMTFAMYGALSGFIFAFIIYLQTKLGYSSLEAGLSLLPVSLLIILFSSRTGAYAAKNGARLFMTIGPLIASLGIFYLYFLKPGDSYIVSVFPGTLLFAIGMCLTVAPLTSLVMSSVDDNSSGIASGINNAVSRTAGLIVIAVLGIFGAAHAYQFSMALATALTLLAGTISFLTIRNIKITKSASKSLSD